MTGYRMIPVLFCSLVAGCSWVSDRQDTIGSLPDRISELPASGTLNDTRNQAVNSYRQYRAEAPEGSRHADATRRIADLQLESEEPAVHTGDHRDAGDVQPDSEVVGLYKEFLETYPDNPQRDGVLYQLSRAYEYHADPGQALATLDTLVQQSPDSVHYAEAQFRRGEILFVNRSYAEAEEAYAAVLSRGESSGFYEQALYKIGWARFKQSDYQGTLDAHIRLLDYVLLEENTAQEQVTLSRADQEMLDDTLRVVSLAFSYNADPKAVSTYFKRNGRRPYEYRIYSSLGELYLSKERFTDAANTFQTFVDSNATHREAPLFQVRVIDAYKKGNFSTLVLESKRNFVERYELGSGYWSHHDPVQRPDVMQDLRANVLDLARHAHALAQKSKKATDYGEAARWYRSFLTSFPEDAQAPEVNFMLAELLYESGRYADAAHEYEKTAYGYVPHARASRAGYAALLSYRKHGETLKGSEASTWHRRGIDSALRFSATYPQHPEALRVTTRAAEELFALNELELAASTARTVIDRQNVPRELSVTAWTVLAHARFDLADYERAEAAYQEVLKLTPASDKQRGALTERLAASVYKQGEAHKQAGDMQAAVDSFLRVQQVAPGTSIVLTAEYDAAAGLIALQQWDRAAVVLERFRRTWPEHKLQPEVTQKLAIVYLEGGKSGKAAAEFERISQLPGSSAAVRREASWQAAELYEKAGQARNAVNAYAAYVERYPAPLEPAVEARQRMADMELKLGNRKLYRQWLESIVKADAQAGTSRTDRTRFLAANASLTLAEPLFESYRRVRLTLPLKKSLKAKKREMERVLKAYEKATDYDVAGVTTAATWHIAEVYRDLADALMDSSRPKNLSPEELEQYEILLEEQAYPFEEKAIEIHEANLRRTTDGIYDEWVAKSLQQLEMLMPVRYAKHERGPDFVEAIH